ncbi:MAG: hypothetical protein KGD64_02610 [Candidatus Heimdallarchaeota archaeon]|nr:hypothetical protein [Candidatus Heimdallarchaeota archaeon]
MKKQDLDSSLQEIGKAREYLKESQKNLERLKSGKGVKRKFRFLFQENKILVVLLSVLIILSIVLPVVFLRPEPVVTDPMQEHVDSTINLIFTNFTDSTGLPFTNETVQTPSSELLILSSLTYALIEQAGFEHNKNDFQTKISKIINTLENDTFVSYINRSESLSIFYQFLGIYTLLQSYFTLTEDSAIISTEMIRQTVSTVLDSYYSSEKGLIIQPMTNSSYLKDQAIAVWVLASYQLLTGTEYLVGYWLVNIISSILIEISQCYFNSTTSTFYSDYDYSINESTSIATIEDLIFLTAALSKSERLHHLFTRSSYNVHQQIITDFVDDDWYVHSSNRTDNEKYIKNQAYFTLVSYLMNLNNVGSEVQNKITENFSLNYGFVEKEGEVDITCESCLYGLIALSSKNWSVVENDRESAYEATSANSSHIRILLASLVLATLLISRRRIFIKRRW